MTVLLTLWLLFVLPVLVFATLLLGAHIYHAGQRGVSPRLAMPRFTFTHKNGSPPTVSADQRLPEV